MWFIPSREGTKPRLLLPPLREKKRESTTRRTFLRTAVPPQTRGPGFPGARAGRPLSRLATSPLRRASRHLFAVRVFQRAVLPRGHVLAAVPGLLGSRARFRALCLTPRFFEPRCRRTNSAISLLDARARSSNSCPRPHRLGVATFPPNHRSPEGADASHGIPRGVAPRRLRVGARAPEAKPRRVGDELTWAERPE